MTQSELDDLIAQHELWFKEGGEAGQQLKLSDVDLGGLRMDGRRLHDSVLHRVNLTRCPMEKTKLHRSVLEDVVFDGVIANGTEFRDAKLTRCSFRDAALKGALFDSVIARHCDFSRSLMAETHFIKASVQSTCLDRCDFTCACFLRCSMHDCSLLHAVLRQADFRTKLYNVDLRFATIEQASLDYAYWKSPRVYGLQGYPAGREGCVIEAPDYSVLGDGSDVRSQDYFFAHVGE